jgi:hypothetical protein
MKKYTTIVIILIVLLLSLGLSAIGQTKYARPTMLVDYVGRSSSVNFGFCLGDPKFLQTIVLVGAVSNQPNSQTLAASFGWRGNSGRLLFLPMFTYSGKNYQDVSLRLGYYLDQNKQYNVNAIASTYRGYGIGINLYFTK